MKQDVVMRNNDEEEKKECEKDEIEVFVINQEKFYVEDLKADKEIRVLAETYFIKSMNNFIKTLLIQDAVGRRRDLSILDLCCGKGGDLAKWQKANIAHYVGSDLSD